MLLVLAQVQREHSEGKEILQGEEEEEESAESFFPFPHPGVSLLGDVQGTSPRELGRLSSTCTTGNARLHENINIFCINRKFEGKSKNMWEQRLEKRLCANSASAKAEEQAQHMRKRVPGYGEKWVCFQQKS